MGVDVSEYRARIGTFRHSVGVAVFTVVCCVNFSGGLKTIGSVIFIGILLLIAGVESNPGPLTEDKTEDSVEQYTSIKVSNLPENVEEDYLRFFFERHGGKVKEVQITEQSRSALIVFEEVGAVQKILAQQLDILKTRVQITVCENDLSNASSAVEYESTISRVQKQRSDFMDCLKLFGLEDKYRSKITLMEVLSVHMSGWKAETVREAPWKLLRAILSTYWEARDLTLERLIKKDLNECDVPESEQSSSKIRDINPLDFFHLVLQCCDHMLQQVVFQKLYLCKIAMPFVYTNWETEPPQSTILSWPLRFLPLEAKVADGKNLKTTAYDLPTNVAAFARFGSPSISKSKLLNCLLSKDDCKTFFNVDCDISTTRKSVCTGTVEIFWLPTAKSDIKELQDVFKNCLTFLNMRGDLKTDCSKELLPFLASVSDIFVMTLDKATFYSSTWQIKSIVDKFKSVVLLFADNLEKSDKKNITDFFQTVLKEKPNINLDYVCMPRTYPFQNVSVVRDSILDKMNTILNGTATNSLEFHLEGAMLPKDENTTDCCQGKLLAEKLVRSMLSEAKLEEWISKITPVQFTPAVELGKLRKKLTRETDISVADTVRTEISKKRYLCFNKVAQSLELFANSVLQANETGCAVDFFNGWLHYFIGKEKSKVLPLLIYEYQKAVKELEEEKKKTISDRQIQEKEETVKQMELKVDNASFSSQYLYRELMHMYDAFLEHCEECGENEERIHTATFRLPDIEQITDVLARLVVNGQQIEIIDELSFHFPFKWLNKIFAKIQNHIGYKKVLCLSVQGLQSSGKSSFLNTMFGVQFPVNIGRCTRGIHMQSIPFETHEFSDVLSPFEYIAVFDTEGLRSTELATNHYEHDNELATVITGIGDTTVINIMGEHTTEVKDILQIVVHAFLRLKQTSESLDMAKSCCFVYNNVTGTLASEDMQRSNTALVRVLDKMTKASAEVEEVIDVKAFSHVIEFDNKRDVWFLKSLWTGIHPVIRVNSEYTSCVAKIKEHLVQNASNRQNKSYRNLKDVLIHINNLWHGILDDDFVFSFRSSLEIKAYNNMERDIQNVLWTLHKTVQEKSSRLIVNSFAECYQTENLNATENQIMDQICKILQDQRTEMLKKIDRIFDGDYKDILSQWKQAQIAKCQNICSKLEQEINFKALKQRDKRCLEIITISSYTKHEKELEKKSMFVADEVRKKGKKLSEEEKQKLFDEIWESCTKNIHLPSRPVQNELSGKKLQEVFLNHLRELFQTEHVILKQALENTDNLEKKPCHNRLNAKALPVGESDTHWSYRKLTGMLMPGSSLWPSVKAKIKDMFKTVDSKLEKLEQNYDITESDIRTILYDLTAQIDDMKFKFTELSFKKSFEIKLCVHVSQHAFHRFNALNENYYKKNPFSYNRLDEYKTKQKISFEAHLNNRSVEDTFARQIANVLETFIRKQTYSLLPRKVADYLYANLPSRKQILIASVLKELVEKNDFESFLGYIKYPEGFSKSWLRNRCNTYLFAGEVGGYVAEGTKIVNNLYKIIKRVVNGFREKNEQTKRVDIKHSVDLLIICLKEEDIIIPADSFHSISQLSGQINNFEYMCKALADYLLESQKQLISAIKETPKFSVKWGEYHPVEDIVHNAWGCQEQCPFCWEPCARASTHERSNHYCLQHRPICCTGSRESANSTALYETCNFLVHSKMQHDCETFFFVCNERDRVPCLKKRHTFREYKTYLPEWDIPPNSDVQATSKFWLWFVAKYKDKLAEYYGYQMKEIPQSWVTITEEAAIKSINEAAVLLI